MIANQLVTLVVLALMAAGQKPDLLTHRPGLWSLPPRGDMVRWVEIHDLDQARKSGLFHIEVLGRRRGDPAWKIEHLLPHMAITTMALRRSIVEPLTAGSVYPETFDDAYRRWQKTGASAGGAPICETTLDECLRALEGQRRE